MVKSQIHVSAPNLLCICIDKAGGGRYVGRMYDKYSKQPFLFEELGQLVNRMEYLFDRIGYPQASTAVRHFAKDKTNRIQKKEGMMQVLKTEDIISQSGSRATFVVHVQYRQNATWQGNIMWAETQQCSSFRSALELLKLIDGALNVKTKDGDRSVKEKML
ncbi:hypothetical protein [Clostridium sp. MCC353]|uniref:hypothetical protein n=1 Tax=Clostridium sp. MCC353 TaxID=2592646 RepID=UPI0020796FF6|nr:hypothetical protein [Clostridium sp. MCC353]